MSDDSSSSSSSDFCLDQNRNRKNIKTLHTDDSDDDDDDPFTFKKHKFGGSANNKRPLPDSDDDSDDSVVEAKKSSSLKSSNLKNIYEIGDSSSSDECDLVESKTKSQKLNPDTTKPISKPNTLNPVLDIDDSDDSDPGVTSMRHFSSLETANISGSASLGNVLKEVREARERLKRAQKHTVPEPVINIPPPLPIPHSAMNNSTFSHLSKAAASSIPSSTSSIPLGPIVTLKLRAQIKPKDSVHPLAKSIHGKEMIVKVRRNQDVKSLIDRYKCVQSELLNLPWDIKLSFDGEILQMNKPISSYDIEDDDLIDAYITVMNSDAHKSHAKLSPTAPSSTFGIIQQEDRITIIARIKGGDPSKTHIYQLKRHDPLSKLTKAYRDMHQYSSFKAVHIEYNNSQLDENKSPYDYQMTNNCQIEIIDETQRQKQVARMPQLATSIEGNGDVVIPQAGQIKIIFRVNDKEKTLHTFGIMPNSAFKTVMEQFCSKVGVNISDCRFVFDGENLSPNQTPNDLDLEGDEMIDVKMPESQAHSSAKVPTSLGSQLIGVVKATLGFQDGNKSVATRMNGTSTITPTSIPQNSLNSVTASTSLHSSRQILTHGTSLRPNTLSSSNSTPTSIPISASSTSQEERITITARIKGGDPSKTHIYQLKRHDPLSKLTKAYRDMHQYSSFKAVHIEYNNSQLDENKSPYDYQMTNNCQIEIIDETQRQKQVARMPQLATSIEGNGDDLIPQAGQIKIIFRVNDKEKTLHTFGIMPNNAFKTVMEQFCSKVGVNISDCRFVFDGENLNPNQTANDLDLEGDEIVDVKISKFQTEPIDIVAPSRSVNQTFSSHSVPLNVNTFRNHMTEIHKTKRFRVMSTDTVLKLEQGYVKYYSSKGCNSVKFYCNGRLINPNQTFTEAGIIDNQVLAGVENGRKYMLHRLNC